MKFHINGFCVNWHESLIACLGAVDALRHALVSARDGRALKSNPTRADPSGNAKQIAMKAMIARPTFDGMPTRQMPSGIVFLIGNTTGTRVPAKDVVGEGAPGALIVLSSQLYEIPASRPWGASWHLRPPLANGTSP